MYLDGASMGMCYSIEKALRWLDCGNAIKDAGFVYLQTLIPEFNPEFLQASKYERYWWDVSDEDSRLAAFDRLIEIYS